MNVIILAQNRSEYRSGYYHNDLILAFQRIAKCYLYGHGYPDYDQKDQIEDVISKSPFTKADVDLIVVATSWELEDPKVSESDPHPTIKLGHLHIPRVFFLNKEYKNLDRKLEYAHENRFDLVCTVHHNYANWARQTGIRFLQVPFAADPMRFKDQYQPRRYDFGFTGSLHSAWTDARTAVKRVVFRNPNSKSNLSLFSALGANPLANPFRKYQIYWAEWGSRDWLGRSRLPHGERYARFLNSCKTFLNSPSAIGIVNTRFFECMAVRTLIVCPESQDYRDLFRNNLNCLMFKPDLSDFTQVLERAIEDDTERGAIVDRAHQEFLCYHTYDQRIETVLEAIRGS